MDCRRAFQSGRLEQLREHPGHRWPAAPRTSLSQGDFDIWQTIRWVDATLGNKELDDGSKRKVLQAIRDLAVQLPPRLRSWRFWRMLTSPLINAPHQLALQRTTRAVGNEYYDWDRMLPFCQAALGRKDYTSAVVLGTGMLANIPNVDESRKKGARELVTQALSQMGGVGLTIDDSSPLAPLLQAAMYYRLGDEALAFDTYSANKALFRENRNQLPPDLLQFVCERLMAGGLTPIMNMLKRFCEVG
ncbi:MAG: hypothetical protein R3C05_24340 [Pirellulaceae bacterium]